MKQSFPTTRCCLYDILRLSCGLDSSRSTGIVKGVSLLEQGGLKSNWREPRSGDWVKLALHPYTIQGLWCQKHVYGTCLRNYIPQEFTGAITYPWSGDDLFFCHQIPDIYRQVSNISRSSVGNQIVDHSDAVGASPVGAAPTTSSFSTLHLASTDWVKTTTRWDEKHLSFGIWCGLY